jgi:predicted MFS family arabinose efflux permease
MIGLAAYIGALVYGRMTKHFTRRILVVLLVAALATTLLSALITRQFGMVEIILAAVFQFVLLAVIFAIGVPLGRWLDRKKDAE